MTPASAPTPTLGIVVLGLGHQTLPGMVGNDHSHPEGTLVEFVHADDLLRRAVEAEPRLLADVSAAAGRLIAQGANAIATSCGYFAPFQRPLSSALPVPVYTTPMMELPSLLASLPEERGVLVLAAVASGVDDRCLDACGVRLDDRARVVVIGMDRPGHFADCVLTHAVDPDPELFPEQIVDVVRQALVTAPLPIGAIVLECGEMPAAAAALRAAVDLPVVDYATYLDRAVALG